MNELDDVAPQDQFALARQTLAGKTAVRTGRIVWMTEFA
jgi:hypothetical protein